MHPETDPPVARPSGPGSAPSVADAPPRPPERTPERAAERPNDRAESMGRVAREIGHDLNNCLGIVGGRAELVLMHLDRGQADSARKGLEVILGQVERMKELSDALRELNPRV
jgi:signal transduction histidine kinase